MLSDSVALQSVQGTLNPVGSHRYVRYRHTLQCPCPILLLIVHICFMGHGTQPQTSDHGTNWTMLQSGKGALLRNEGMSRAATCSAEAVLAV